MIEGQTASRSILLAEDSDDQAELMTYALSAADPSVVVHRVPDGEETIAFLRRTSGDEPTQAPAVVFLDLKMPKVDGLEVLEVIKQDPALREIPIIILTTSESPKDRKAALERHANAYVVKPLGLSALREMTEQTLAFWLGWAVVEDSSPGH